MSRKVLSSSHDADFRMLFVLAVNLLHTSYLRVVEAADRCTDTSLYIFINFISCIVLYDQQ